MSYPPKYEMGDMPTEKENEHAIHKSEGSIFTWCEYCRMEEFCIDCQGTGLIKGDLCDACESSGRKI